MSDTRPDVNGWFDRWHDAYHEAMFRAAMTGRRYRVRYDPANRWWDITELGTGRSGIRSLIHRPAGRYSPWRDSPWSDQ